MFKLALLLAVLVLWGAWLIHLDKWGVTSLVIIPVFGAAAVVQIMLFRIIDRSRKDE